MASTVVIIGGGLAGLTTAFRLCGRYRVVLLEAAPRLGGQIHTELCDGFVIERGAEGFVARSQALPALVADLGMPEGELIGQSTLRSYGYDGRQLLALQPGEAASFLGFQVPPEDLGKGIRSLRRGMASLVWALSGNLRERADVRLQTRVERVLQTAGGVRVELAHGPAVEADAAVVATNAAAASALLQPVAGELARALSAASTLSSVTVELVYPRAAVAHALDGTGFVVSQAAQRDGLRACTFTTSKFVDRAPPGHVSLRAFFRPAAGEAAVLPAPLAAPPLDDAAWRARAVAGIGRVLALQGEPLRAFVSRWPDALPVFDNAHTQRVAALEAALAGRPVLLAGAAFHGAGIDAAVRSGERAAAALR